MVTKKSMNFMDQKVRRLRELERSGMDTGQIKANAPGGNISRPIRKVAQKKKTPSNAPGGMMKPRPPRPPRPKATNTSAQTRAKVADLKKQIKKLMGQYK
jgi:hypothetical protein